KNNTATVDPTVNDAGSSGYAVGSRWFNSATKNTFICTDATNGAAVWQAVPLGYISGTQVYMDGGTY
ncbi:MAG: hypothetical protein KGL63_14800, partial [Betaproteobacteria bacterium]|nr:hypothetical protein [Betaproteobacteria bacterium]